MVFASGIFLFVFLPVTIAGNYVLRNHSTKIRNLFLLLMSAFFYLESGVAPFLLLILSIIMNYSITLGMVFFDRKQNISAKRNTLILAVIYNVGMLFVFKYLRFVMGEIPFLFGGILPEWLSCITLPLGISFYTFQALSYVIDVYRDSSLVEWNIVNVALYISFFPQLIAGPIVRWDSIHDTLLLENRCGYWNEGFKRFAIGLGKKVIIANQMAVFADKAFSLLEEGNLTTGFAWLGAITYTLQIYFDFSGYSDMAIGLGKMFGFNFQENFNYPYISKSITEFWRRWHISLSSWFKDYVYVPLGGNRCNKSRMYFNLFIVWMLTGIWHGANYTFWLWGLFYFVVLLVEKTFISRKTQNKGIEKRWVYIFETLLGHIYTMFIVILLWVLFRADSVSQALQYMKCMFTKSASSVFAIGVTRLYFRNFIGYGIVAVIGCTPWVHKIKIILDKYLKQRTIQVLSEIYIVFVFILACCVTIDSNYNPFIYFNF